jgi:hypothetical protein
VSREERTLEEQVAAAVEQEMGRSGRERVVVGWLLVPIERPADAAALLDLAGVDERRSGGRHRAEDRDRESRVGRHHEDRVGQHRAPDRHDEHRVGRHRAPDREERRAADPSFDDDPPNGDSGVHYLKSRGGDERIPGAEQTADDGRVSGAEQAADDDQATDDDAE